MIKEIPNGPFFVPKFKIDPSGVDFLGMRQANLDLMDICLPGINNYTRYLRGFSVLAWIYWKFHDLMKSNESEQVSSETLIRFKEKAEILFTWGHQGLGLPKVPGIEAKPPASVTGEVELSFDAWRRAPDNTSLMAAPTYGPASKTTGGLSFLDPVKVDVFRACGNGVHLAEYLDAGLKELPEYDHLISLDAFTANEATAKAILPAWDLRTPSEPEKLAFSISFYDPDSIETATALGRRSATIALILELLSESKEALTENDICTAMAYRRLKNKPILSLSAPLEMAWLRWFVLQIRQAQRLAFESILAWVEHRLLDNKDHDTVILVDRMLDLLGEYDDIIPAGETPEIVAAVMFTDMNSVEAYLDLADTDENYCLFGMMAKIIKSLKTNASDLISLSLRLLFICSKLTDYLVNTEGGSKLLIMGGTERISLKYWHTIFSRFSPRPFEELARFLLENLVLSQHYGVAAYRFDGNKQRLRIGVEEEGLVALIQKPLKPFVGDDRLGIALCLLADCGLITDISKNYTQGIYTSSSAKQRDKNA